MSFSKEVKGLFSYGNLVHAIAGGCGSAVAMSTFYPLDTVRTRLQLEDRRSASTLRVLQDLHKEEGVLGLYRGLLPVIESLFCSNFVYFYTFHGLKKMGNQEKSALRDLLFGIIAGCTNVMATTPLWVVNTRIKMQGTKLQGSQQPPHRIYSGLIDGILKIWKDEGIPGLWSGCLSSLILVINPAIQFMTYEAVKNHMLTAYKGKELGSLTVFLTGALAKAVATVLTYPIQLVQAKQRHGHKYEGLPQNAGVVTLLCYILRTRGVKGLFKGMEAKIIQTVLTAALMFVCYEKIAAVVFAVLMGKRRAILVKQ